MIARLAGVALDARFAPRTSCPRERAVMAQWICANLLGAAHLRAVSNVDPPCEASVVSIRAESLRAILGMLAAMPVLVHPATLPLRWRAVLRTFGVPVLEGPVEDALAGGASVALLAA